MTQSRIEESIVMEGLFMNYKTGLQLGAFADLQIVKNLKVRPGLQLTQKGFKAKVGNPDGLFYWEREESLTYLEIPINFIYNFTVSKKVKLLVGAGPVLSFGLFGKSKTILIGSDGTGQIFTEDRSDNSPFEKPGYKKVDLGADLLFGIQYSRLMITADYNHGLLNMINYDQGTQWAKNRSFAFSIGYFLNR